MVALFRPEHLVWQKRSRCPSRHAPRRAPVPSRSLLLLVGQLNLAKTVLQKHATRDYLHPSPIPSSAQMVDPLGLRDSLAADRRRGHDEPVSAGSIAKTNRGTRIPC